MTAEQNLKIALQVVEEAFNQGNFTCLKRNFRPGYVEHQFGLHTTIEGMQEDIMFLRKAFPDFNLRIENVAAVEDKVWLHMTARGTNLGGLMGPPNGKSFEIAVFDLLRFEQGQIVEHWGSPDRFAQMSQLGLLPQKVST
jgi:predicted ester cyclase